jgi:hypothetical protein
MADIIDLHIHSNRSDGIHPPREVVAMAAAAGVTAMALADHDALDGIDDALEEGARLGIAVIPAVELSVAYADLEDIHLLGFHVDHRDQRFLQQLQHYRDGRTTRCHRMVERINQRLAARGKKPISLAEIEEQAAGAIGRPHMARVLMAHGYVRTMQDAFEQYLIPCDVPKSYFPMAEAIAEIHRTGGVAVLAHPHSISDDRNVLENLVAEFVSLGLDGIEAYNNLCDDDESAFLQRLALRHGLLVTGGSDFHGGNDGIEIGRVRGSITVPADLLAPLAAKARRTA